MTVDHDTQEFVTLCVPLTGFPAYDLHGTGMAELYLDTARGQVGAERFAAFLAAWRAAVGKGAGPDTLSPVHREVARAVTYLWYTGAWPRLAPAAHAELRRQMANTEFMASAGSYPEGLVWRTFNGHPGGAKPPGYATWAMKPPPVATEAQIRAALRTSQAASPPVSGEVPPHLLPGFRSAPSVSPSEVPRAAEPARHKAGE